MLEKGFSFFSFTFVLFHDDDDVFGGHTSDDDDGGFFARIVCRKGIAMERRRQEN
jgi:hypothetical protein